MKHPVIFVLTASLLLSPVSPAPLIKSSKTVVLDIPEQVINKNELLCLANAVYFEAEGESILGKAAVARVILRRSSHRDFPGTICRVVYQRTTKRCQFSFVCFPRKVKDMQAYQLSQLVAYRVLRYNQWNEVVPDALYFHSTSVHANWHLPKLAKIGRQVFYGEKT